MDRLLHRVSFTHVLVWLGLPPHTFCKPQRSPPRTPHPDRSGLLFRAFFLLVSPPCRFVRLHPGGVRVLWSGSAACRWSAGSYIDHVTACRGRPGNGRHNFPAPVTGPCPRALSMGLGLACVFVALTAHVLPCQHVTVMGVLFFGSVLFGATAVVSVSYLSSPVK